MNILKQIQDAKARTLALALMALVPDDVIDDVGISMNSALQEDLATVRANPDFIGFAASAIALFMTHSPMTRPEKLVAMQILSVTASALYADKAVLSETLDANNVLTEPSLGQKLGEKLAIFDHKGGEGLTGEAFYQELAETYQYIEKWDRYNMKKGGIINTMKVGEDETSGGSLVDGLIDLLK
jgi:hypothetical protein